MLLYLEQLTDLDGLIKKQLKQRTMKETYKALHQVNEFMAIMGQEMPESPTIPNQRIVLLREGLIEEENTELSAAATAGDIVEVADALCDTLYVVLGAFTAYGFKPELVEELFDEVQRSNMSKICKTQEEAQSTMFNYATETPSILTSAFEKDGLWIVERKSDKKVLKSINYSEPDLKSILERHGVKC